MRELLRAVEFWGKERSERNGKRLVYSVECGEVLVGPLHFEHNLLAKLSRTQQTLEIRD